METAFFLVVALLLCGFVLRAGLRIFQVLYVPASVIGGLIGMCAMAVLMQLSKHWTPLFEHTPIFGWHDTVQWMTGDVAAILRSWPSWLIAVIFGGLLIERPGKPFGQSIRLAAREGIMVWIIVLGEVTVGLAATWLIIGRYYDVPASFGQLIEAGFAGGHGTAGAIGDIYEKSLAFSEGKDLAFFFATVGLIVGVLTGIVYINIAACRGWTRAGHVKIPLISGLEDRQAPKPIAFGTVRSDVIDPLVFQAMILAVAVVLGMALKAIVLYGIPLAADLLHLAQETRGDIIKCTGNLPLFMFTLIGGLLLREAMHLAGFGNLIDPHTIRRITGAAMEFLIVAAITSLKLSALVTYGWPVALLLLLGFIWTGFCLLFVARRMLPRDYWFELGILNYGMSTGTTAQGLMLLRIIDKDLESGAAEDYALAAPLSAPFIGGGILTISLPLILLNVHIGYVVALFTMVLVVLYSVGRRLVRLPRAGQR